MKLTIDKLFELVERVRAESEHEVGDTSLSFQLGVRAGISIFYTALMKEMLEELNKKGN